MIHLKFDRGTLLLSAPEQEIDGILPGKYWKWDDRVNAWRCEAMHYAKILEELDKHFGDALQNRLPPWPRVFHAKQPGEPDSGIIPAITAWTNAGRCGQVIVPEREDRLMLATQAMASHPCSTLVITSSADMACLWHNTLTSELGCEAGIIGGGDKLLRPVSTATYGSARIRMAKIGMRFEMVIFDEAHLLGDGAAREAAILCTAPLRLGMPCDSERTDGLVPLLASLTGPIVGRVNRKHGNHSNRAVSIPVRLSDAERCQYEECTRICDEFIASMKSAHPRYNLRDLRRDSGRDAAARTAKNAMVRAASILASADEKLQHVDSLLKQHRSVAIFSPSDDTAMDISTRFGIPAILRVTPGWERSAILDGARDGRFPALVYSTVPSERSALSDSEAAVFLHPSRRSNIAASKIYNIYCCETHEDPDEGKVWKYDAYRRRVGH